MIVVADTSPLSYLVLIDAVHLLPALYGVIHIPYACAQELAADRAPRTVRCWFQDAPDWLAVHTQPLLEDSRHAHLDRGERDAIALAFHLGADLILIDDRDGRSAARSCGLAIEGTLRVLARGANAGLIDLENAFNLLRATTFRVDPAIMQALLDENG